MKKYNKAFTLVELLAVIVLLSVIMVIGISAISSSAKDVNEKIYESKITSIETAAVLYGQDTLETGTITVKTLAEAGYIVYDEVKGETKKVTDPRGKLSSLNNCTVTISVSGKKTTAMFNKNSCE